MSKKLEDAPYSVIPYGCIEGVIYPAGATLKSNFNLEKEGVMQHTSLVEHKSRRVQGIWYFIVFFFHLLLIIVIVQNYHFCHFWTILNKSYNWNWWKKTKAKNSSLISASLQINVEKFSGMKKKFLMEIYDWKSDISFHSQILRNNSHSLSKFHSWVTLMLFAMQNADRIFIFLAETAKTWQDREDVWKEKS